MMRTILLIRHAVHDLWIYPLHLGAINFHTPAPSPVIHICQCTTIKANGGKTLTHNGQAILDDFLICLFNKVAVFTCTLYAIYLFRISSATL